MANNNLFITKNKGLISLGALLGVIMFVVGCKPHDNPVPPAPDKVALIFPAQNALCTSGTVISNTQTTIILTWGASANTDSYEVDIKNLVSGIILTQTANTNQLSLTLQRGTPYSWYVVSKSGNTTVTTQSDTWKFYVAGMGATSYPPFPAAIVTPVYGAFVTTTGNTVNLSWTGSDVDNDIASYDVYFGTTSNPTLLKAGVADMFLNGVNVISGNTYYWKIVTKDSQNNTSESGVYQFKVN